MACQTLNGLRELFVGRIRSALFELLKQINRVLLQSTLGTSAHDDSFYRIDAN
jgi:hypothetical protein